MLVAITHLDKRLVFVWLVAIAVRLINSNSSIFKSQFWATFFDQSQVLWILSSSFRRYCARILDRIEWCQWDPEYQPECFCCGFSWVQFQFCVTQFCGEKWNFRNYITADVMAYFPSGFGLVRINRFCHSIAVLEVHWYCATSGNALIAKSFAPFDWKRGNEFSDSIKSVNRIYSQTQIIFTSVCLFYFIYFYSIQEVSAHCVYEYAITN